MKRLKVLMIVLASTALCSGCRTKNNDASSTATTAIVTENKSSQGASVEEAIDESETGKAESEPEGTEEAGIEEEETFE